MREVQEVQLHIIGHEDKEASPELAHTNVGTNQDRTELWRRNYKWWLRLSLYAIFVLAGQASATLLERLYYKEGGQSKWIGTLVQSIGFPVLIPIYFLCSSKNPATSNGDYVHSKEPSKIVLASVYITLGLLVGGVNFLCSVGLLYLSVSTYTLISASQLGFTSVFSFFINSQKFTPFVLNSVVLLTVSSALLVFHANGADSTRVSKVKYTIGFICTVGGAATYGLFLALVQFFFRKVIKVQTVRVVLEMMIGVALVASFIVVVGLLASGEWKGLREESGKFGLGKVSYVMTLVWTAISWQVFAVGTMGLVYEVTSLFCNVIIALGLPLVQVLAVLTFHDKMDGLKVISLLLAIWGFVSYIYQHYLDDYSESKTDLGQKPNEGVCRSSPLREVNE